MKKLLSFKEGTRQAIYTGVGVVLVVPLLLAVKAMFFGVEEEEE